MLREAPDAQGQGAADPITPDAAPVEAPDLSFVPADFVADGKPDLAAFSTHYQELATRAAQHDERMATVPEEYSFSLPEDFSPGDLPLPEGLSFAVDAEDEAVKPLLSEVSSILKDLGAPADASPKIMAVLAKYEAIKESRRWSEFQTDVETLGGTEKFTQRFDNLKRTLETKLAKEDADAILQGNRVSAGAMRALEKLLAPKGLPSPTPQPQPVDPLAVRYPRSA